MKLTHHYCTTPARTRSRSRSWTPFAQDFPLGEELMREFFGRKPAQPEASGWAPRVDVHETDTAYVFQVELPGIKPDSVELTFRNDTLTLQGEKTLARDEGTTYHLRERTAGNFQRTFSFRKPVDPNSISARSEHGLLTIEVQKAAEAQARKIEIQGL